MDYYDNVPEFSLTITGGGESGQRFVFSQPEVTLGRIADNDLVLYDPAVSRRHIVVYFRNNQFLIEDLGSSNGTLLNGYMLNQPTVLCEGDVVEVGAVRFEFSETVSETDDPTEVEASVSNSFQADPSKAPMVRRWDDSGNLPLPPEGDTRTFAPKRIQNNSPQAPAGYQQGAIPAQPHYPPERHQQPTNQYQTHGMQGGAPGPSRPPSGIAPPNQPPPQMNVPMPNVPMPNVPMPSMPMPAHSSRAQHPSPQARRPQYPSAPPSRPLESATASRREKRHMQFVFLWSCLLFVVAAVLMFVPLKPRIVKNDGEGKPPTLIEKSIYQKVFGCNRYSKNNQCQGSGRVSFRFFHRNGRSSLSYRVISPNAPLQISINNQQLFTIAPTESVWLYNRHRLSRDYLKPFQFNTITFTKTSTKSPQNWGITHIELREKPLPAPNVKKATHLCKQADESYLLKSKKPENRYTAISYFLQCQDHLARLKPLPPLYTHAKIMISRIEAQLEVIFDKKLQNANLLLKSGDKTRLRELYRELLRFFPEPRDPRYRRILDLQQKL